MIAPSQASPTSSTSVTGATASIFPSGKMLAFALVTAIFFLWGMSNNLTDILQQQFKKSFELSVLQAQFVSTAVFLAYGTMAIPAAQFMRRFGYKAGILTGLLTFSTGVILFLPAAFLGKYALFLLALFVCGSGQSILETACNPFIAEFGSPETSERRLNFSQAFNPPGTIAGVLIGTLFIFSGVEKTPGEIGMMKSAGTYAAYLQSETMRVVPTYVGFAIALLVLTVLIWRTAIPKMQSELVPKGENPGIGFSLLGRYPHLLFAVVAQFFYVGAQVATWSNFILYMRTYTTQPERACGYFLTGSLVALGIGRVVSTGLMRYVSAAVLMRVYALINIGLVLVAVVHPGMVGAMALLVTSFFMSIMFPTIFALGVKGLGADTKLGGSLIVTAIVGGAIFPLALGVIARSTGSLALGYIMPAVGYAVVAVYGFMGSGAGAGATEHEVAMAPIA
jgi:FHS family L-fucose permease-like MFS transporter